ncbi:tannase/feruloyl esterase family alpha/beta hydrolase [Polaromonas sp. UC242_47]|uniref:tannase/feruloyl esterase family alpha/beta hydrolase n=1 Tax=Polaromonas sp. UC242_47 TaxID=3374626 RepID=UPI00379AB9B6
MPHTVTRLAASAAGLLLLAACSSTPPMRPAATGASAVVACEGLAAGFSFAGTRILSTQRVDAGQLKLPGIAEAMPAHCVLKGAMHERIGPMDGKPYAIGFEMRLPTAWNGRFFYQANGGLDGFQTPAYGDILGGGPISNGLLKGFAVISSDAGHAFDRNTPIGGATFGLDPQARLDYGYNAVAQLTPMAKALIKTYYGKGPDTSYLVGSSNGGRHGFVTASRLPAAYDGILVSTPGYRLPLAAAAQVWGAQQFARIAKTSPATGRPDLSTALTPADLALLARQVLARCDALDGLADGIVADLQGCQAAFNITRDVPSCAAGTAPDGHCLSAVQKTAMASVAHGPVTAAGQRVYAGLPWDPGMAGRDWASWKFVNSVGPRDAIALAFVMSTPPASPAVVTGQGNTLIDYALQFNIDRDLPRLSATAGPYQESAISFMTPPDPTLRSFVASGGKLLVFHGTADPVFSALDSISWYDNFRQAHGAAADSHARLFLVPGMNHSRGGPATDQMDMLEALVRWVELGQAPQTVVAQARGAGAAVPNPEIPASWSPTRTRLLCPYPQVPRYQGSGDSENAASFSCR